MGNIYYLFKVSQSLLNALKQEHTAEAVANILGLTKEVKEKVVNLFHLAEDAADDIVEIALIAMNTLEKVRDDSFRALPKPVTQMTSMDDVVAVTVMEYTSLVDMEAVEQVR